MVPVCSVAEFVFGVLFDSDSEAAFIVTRSDRLVVCVNRRFEDLVGRDSAALLGQSVAALIDRDHDRRGPAIVDQPGHYEDVALSQVDGYPRYVELAIAHVEHPELGPLAACFARDTTERRGLERELIAKHSALYAAHAELEGLVTALRAAQQELEARNQEISFLAGQVARVGWRAAIGELAAGIAHHLNNPVAALASTLRTIGTRLDADPDRPGRAELDQLMQRALGAVGRIEEQVAAVVRLHRAGTYDATPRWLDLARELDTSLTMFKGRLSSIDVQRDYGGPISAHVPQDPLHHVLGSVIDNAVSAMPAGGVLAIAIARQQDLWVIAVEDSGAGVPAAAAATLFDPIVGVRGRGAGLGLATAHRLARLWGGDLVHRQRQRGACFEITVPACERPGSPTTRGLR